MRFYYNRFSCCMLDNRNKNTIIIYLLISKLTVIEKYGNIPIFLIQMIIIYIIMCVFFNKFRNNYTINRLTKKLFDNE